MYYLGKNRGKIVDFMASGFTIFLSEFVIHGLVYSLVCLVRLRFELARISPNISFNGILSAF